MGITVLLAGNLPSSSGRPSGLPADPDSIPGLDFSSLLASQLTVLPENGKLPTLLAAIPEGDGLPVDIDVSTASQHPQMILLQDWAQRSQKTVAPSTQEEPLSPLLAPALAASKPDGTEPEHASVAKESASKTSAPLEQNRMTEAAALSLLQEPLRTPAQQEAEQSGKAANALQEAPRTTAVLQDLTRAIRAEVKAQDKNHDSSLPLASRAPAPGTFSEALAGRVFVADGNSSPAIVAAESGSGQASPINSVGGPGEKGATPGNLVKDGPASIQAPLNDPRWSQQLGDRVLWMARGDAKTAQINITPANMGPIQISISLQGDQMTAHFISANQEVRQALEDAMPRLREMLSGAGINLGQSNVGAQQQQRDTRAQFAAAVPSAGEEAILAGDASWNTLPAQPLQRGRGMIDLFA